MRKYLQTLAAPVLALAFLANPATAAGPEIQWDLDDAMKQVDRQADDFSTALAQADFLREDRDGQEISRETGAIFFNRDGKIRIDVAGDEPRTYLMDSRYLWVYAEAPIPAGLTALTLSHDALRDLWPEQVNLVNVERDKVVQSATFTRGIREATISF